MRARPATITIQADVNYGGKTRTYEYDALVLCEDGQVGGRSGFPFDRRAG